MSEQYISLLGMLLGVALFIYLIFKKYPLPVGSVLGAIVVAIFSGMPVMTSLTDTFMTSAAGAFKSYLLLLIFSAIFGKVLGDVGACQSIAYKMARLVKKLWPGHEKFLGVMAMGLITCVFCYGGISVFVVIFTLIYIGKELYEELDIPWYMLTVTGMGTGTFAASMIPGSPQLVNIVPMEYYGTPAYAAPVLGMICAVFSFAFTCWWISFKVKRITKRGEGFYPSANEFMKTWTDKGVQCDLAMIGSKGVSFFNSVGGNVVAQVTGMGDNPSLSELIGPVKVMLQAYDEGRLDKLYIVSNKFINTMSQVPTISQLLPLPASDDDDLKHKSWDYLYEPDPKALLDTLLRRYVESQVYQGVVENLASEQAARMVAMKAATDNGGSLIKELQLVYNKARQASITQELTEIVSGAAAV